jgi:uncharacterized PurR-regulated membrane protein YhhQ (DUF165 family)
VEAAIEESAQIASLGRIELSGREPDGGEARLQGVGADGVLYFVHGAASPASRRYGIQRSFDRETKSPGAMRFKYTILYVVLIVAVNWAFTVVPLVALPGGTLWPPVSLVVGFVFVVRDFAQREIEHFVLLAMLVGAVLSYVMADPFVAIASAAAFAVGEVCDWTVYSFTGKTLSERILYSSALGTPVDSAVFLAGVGLFSAAAAVAMTASKMIGALIVWWMIRRREAQNAAPAG